MKRNGNATIVVESTKSRTRNVGIAMLLSVLRLQESGMWDDEELRIFAEFHGKCVRCHRPAIVLHELDPKSKKINWKEKDNRISLCNDCHEWAHRIGAKNSKVELIEIRRLYRECLATQP